MQDQIELLIKKVDALDERIDRLCRILEVRERKTACYEVTLGEGVGQVLSPIIEETSDGTACS